MTPETAAAYETGHGSVVLRATAHVEYEGSKRKKKRANLTGSAASAEADAEAAAAAAAAGGKALIVFTEMPYQVCKVGERVLRKCVWCRSCCGVPDPWLGWRTCTTVSCGHSQHASVGCRHTVLLSCCTSSHETYVSPKPPSCVLPVCLCAPCCYDCRCCCCGRVQSDLVQRIAEMVDTKQLDGITDVRDESDRTGACTRTCRLACMLRPRACVSLSGHWRLGHHTERNRPGNGVGTLGVQCVTICLQQHPPLPGCQHVQTCCRTKTAGVRLVVEVKRGFSPQLVLNQLYKSTRLQLRFSTNMVCVSVSGLRLCVYLGDCMWPLTATAPCCTHCISQQWALPACLISLTRSPANV